MGTMVGWQLRRAVRLYAEHGWPIAPGAWWNTRGYVCGASVCTARALHPAIAEHPTADVAAEASLEPGQLDDWWSEHPYSVLTPTGEAFDVVDVPWWRVASARGALVSGAPVAITGHTAERRALLFVAAGPRAPLAAAGLGTLLHQTGSWVPLPPSPLASPLRWLRPPSAAGWRLPSLDDVVERLAVVPPTRKHALLAGRR